MSESAQHPCVVVGYDGSAAARTALAVAGKRAGADGLVVIVHTYEVPPEFVGEVYYGDMVDRAAEQARNTLDAFPREALGDTAYETELMTGRAASAIAKVATVRDADEIIVGSRGFGRVRALLGSVAHELIHLADRPVTVIPERSVAREQDDELEPSART